MSDTQKSKKSKQAPAKRKQKVDTGAIADAPMMGGTDAPLGTLEGDTSRKAAAAGKPEAEASVKTPGRSTHKKATEAAQVPTAQQPADESKPVPTKQDEPTAPATGTAPAVLGVEPESLPEPLRLPRGAFVGLRKSGGLAFSTREVVVYPDGRVAYDARGVPQKEYTRLRRVMNDGQIISLRKVLDQTGFWVMQSEGKQNPDAFAYEIAARLGQRSNEIQVFDGSIPEKLQPLLERLVKLLPE